MSQLPYSIQKAVHDITRCRTGALGGHKSSCRQCGAISISYNSCRNRHCPKCQFSKREQWILDRKADLLPVTYFHVVFTLPHQLNQLIKAYPGILYHQLFSCAWKTIKTLSEDAKRLNASSGMVALLHTWGQNLSFHPHLHCIIPQGGWDPHTKRWVYHANSKFLFPVRVMSALFKKYFIQALKELHMSGTIKWQNQEWQAIMSDLVNLSFNVFAKKTFASPDNVISYLGRYSHRVAISNNRITDVTKKSVSF